MNSKFILSNRNLYFLNRSLFYETEIHLFNRNLFFSIEFYLLNLRLVHWIEFNFQIQVNFLNLSLILMNRSLFLYRNTSYQIEIYLSNQSLSYQEENHCKSMFCFRCGFELGTKGSFYFSCGAKKKELID